jgi:hypothetical protein
MKRHLRTERARNRARGLRCGNQPRPGGYLRWAYLDDHECLIRKWPVGRTIAPLPHVRMLCPGKEFP